MIKNILFDMGNVLIRFEPKQYVKNAGLSESDQQLLLRELYGSIDWVRLDRGTLTEAEVIDRCVSRVGEHLRGAVEKLVGHWDRPELPVEGMKALTDELYEKGYGLYLLTNAGPRQREYWPRFRAGARRTCISSSPIRRSLKARLKSSVWTARSACSLTTRPRMPRARSASGSTPSSSSATPPACAENCASAAWM